MNPKKERSDVIWTVIGGGNGGQTTAGHLGQMGFKVKIYDIFSETINKINEQGGIYLEGALTGFGKVDLATTNMKEALQDSDIILITVPATAHAEVAKACAPYLVDGQIVVLNPAATFGSLAFRKVLNDEGCQADVTLAETNTLLYGCRLIEAGRTQVFGLKNRILAAALPAVKNDRVIDMLQIAFPQVEAVESVMITSFDNTNPILHPAATLLCTGLVESKEDWLFYVDGYTPSIGRFVEKMDEERLAIAKALGLDLISCREQYEIEYDVFEPTLADSVRKNKVYQGIKGQKSLDTRYLTEDIPMGLVPFASIGRMLNVPVERMELVIKLSESLLEKDLITGARTVENIGIDEMTAAEFMEFVKTGKKNI